MVYCNLINITHNIIKLSPGKSCELDLLPTWLQKECIAELVPLITDIVNMSLREHMLPKITLQCPHSNIFKEHLV